MNRSGAPGDCWLLCMIHASYILNHLSCEALGGNVHLGMLYGVSPDISILLLYTFYQPVFYATHNQSYPSASEERAARWVGFGEHVGDALTHKLLDDDTKKILYRSAVRPSYYAHPNKRLVSDGGESSQTPKPIVFVRSRQDNSQSATKPMAEYNPDDLIGRTFVLPKNEQGERLRATIKRKVIETSKLLDDQHDNAIDKINFHLDVGQGRAEAIMSYVQLLDHLDQQEQQEDLYMFRAITGHHQFGFLIPKDYKQALQLDEQNGNSKWYDATKLEMNQINEYKVFQDHGKAKYDPKSRKVSNAPNGYQKIRVHLIFAVKHDGRHKARSVAGGHLTPDPIESIYSGVVSIRSLRLVVFLAKLINPEVWGADIGNTYLEAKTKENLYIVAGPEFEELEGHILVIYKALYGLKSSGLRWSQKIHDIMLDMGFSPSKADPCVWLRKAKCATKYEYVAIYVDDLLIACDCASDFIHTLKKKYNLKIKREGPLKYHLGCDYDLDPDGTLVAQPKKYISKILESFHQMFPGENLPQVKSPLDKNDHPELDNSELVSDDLITKFMCMVGQLQWAVTLGRYDILAHVMSMSRFRLAPKVGHIERMKRIYGYLSRTKHYALRFRTDEPNYMHLPDLEYDWTRIYGGVLEEIPKDAPEPLGESVTTTTFLDANLLHDLITGRSVTAVLHFFNLTPGDWYSKRQATVENATYGSEFVAAKTAIEQIIDIRQTLRFLGVPIKSKAYMFGDNKSVVTSSTVPHSLLSKRHNILSYHRVREAIAAKILVFHWCDSSQNKSDILSKHWEFSKVFHIIRDLFDLQGKITLIR